jgi:aerobic carbon-monoxide dehydrogenase small subunit
VTHKISLMLNGKDVSASVEANVLLVDFLRDHVGQTGTHIGCDTGQCGACMILINGLPVKSCMLLAVEADAMIVTTIEGLAAGEALHPMQKAFKEHHGLQCGFCTPGMVIAGIGIAERHGAADKETIRRELDGNLCRCTGYHNIVKAIEAGAREMSKTGAGGN